MASRDIVTCQNSASANDVAYFIASNLDTDVRRQNEATLLAHYHRVLVDEGVKGYPLDALKHDYVLSLLAYLGVLIANVTTLDPTNERGVFFCRTPTRGSARPNAGKGVAILVPVA